MIALNIKHTKFSSEWTEEIKKTSYLLDDPKETDETKQKSKQLETLFTERTKIDQENTEIIKEIRKLKTKQKSLSLAAVYHLQAQKEYNRVNNGGTAHNPREKNFLGTGTGTKWRTDGWLKNAENHFKPASGKLDNLYKVKIAGSEVETTEEQAIQLIARVVKAFQKVDNADFEAKYNAKETDTAKQAQVKAYLKEIQDQATEIVVGGSKDAEGNAKQPTYDFSANFHKGKFADDGTWQPEATDYSQPAFDYQHFFDFLTLTHEQAFLTDLDSDKQKNIDKNENWQIFLKGEKWEKDKLADYGIKIDPAKTELWKTSETDKRTISSNKTGIAGWLDLAHSITQNANNKSKLVSAFTNSPTQQLLSDLNGWSQGADGFLTDSTNWTLPESLDSLAEIVAELESDKLASSLQKSKLTDKIKQKTDESAAKKAELTPKETAIDALVKEILTKKREELKSFQIEKGFAKDANADNRRTWLELKKIERLLCTVRYLENSGDTTSPSSERKENTALTEISGILDRVRRWGSEFWGVDYFVDNLSYKKDSASDYQQAINCIKTKKDPDGKDMGPMFITLSEFHKQFEDKEALVKLSEEETQAKNALKAAIDNQSPAETLAEWKEVLKTIDAGLSTDLTETKLTEWRKKKGTKSNKEAFDTAAKVKSLLEKVCSKKADNTIEKVSDDFLTEIKKLKNSAGEMGKIDTVGKLFAEKTPEEVIKLVLKYEYDQSADLDKRKKLVWTLELKDPNDDKKYLEDKELTDEEIINTLYKIGIGELTLASTKRADETNDNNTPTDQKSHLAKYWGWYAGGFGLTVVIGGLTYSFWDKISGLFGGGEKEEGGENSDDE